MHLLRASCTPEVDLPLAHPAMVHLLLFGSSLVLPRRRLSSLLRTCWAARVKLHLQRDCRQEDFRLGLSPGQLKFLDLSPADLFAWTTSPHPVPRPRMHPRSP